MSDLLARLVKAGTPPELVAEVALELARAEAAKEAIEQRRYKDRTRQSEKRLRDNVMSRDVTGHSVTERDTPPSLSPNENNSNPHTHTPENISPRARKADFPKPDWADPQVWSDFLSNRKTKRLGFTATAHAKFLNDIAKLEAQTGWPPGECLRACVARGWGAIFDPRENSNGRSSQNFGSNPDRRDRRDGVARALDRQLGLDDMPLDGRSASRGGMDRDAPVAYLTAVR